jgi:Helicase conserved C-terminal domain
MINDQTYNAFARALATQIGCRAKGLDDESSRIVNVRPQEHVLAGFLTPRSAAHQQAVAQGQDDVVDDLPRDSAFELTSLGLEWLADQDALRGIKSLTASISLNLYVRCTPAFEEQKRLGAWRREPATGSAQLQRVQPVLPVWRRIEIPEFAVEIGIDALLRQKRQRVDITPSLILATDKIPADIYSARQVIYLDEPECATQQAFNSAASRARTRPFSPFWRGFLDVRLISVPTESRVIRVAIRIVNDSPAPAKAQTDFLDPNLYAVRLSVAVPKAVHRPTIFQELPASFRYDRRMPGVGINAHVRDEEQGALLRLIAESVPITETPRLEAREFDNAVPSFSTLSSKPTPILESLARHMEDYNSTQWAAKVATLSGIELEDATRSRREFEQEVLRFKRGLDLLKNPKYPSVLRAFLLMNKAMERAQKSHDKWRLFQIAFIVSVLPELACREYPELAAKDDGFVDLLWFAAGGGKTEAFMGIILWQAFFDRIRGKQFGNTAFVRFPLRLLTFQQLQRLAGALAAAELVRKENGLKGARFSIGYLVGGTVTPNKIDNDLHKRLEKQGVDPKHKRIFKCPFCGAGTTLSYESATRLIGHHCENAICPGGKERLPIYVTDQDIYRFLPTVIVSTVDKLALLGQNHRFSNLFGRITFICGKHGASFAKSNELCEAGAAIGKGDHLQTCPNSGAQLYYGPFHDMAPAILVQDELHLLNEELGTFDAHYETGVIELFKSLGAKPWKIIGATATIQDFARQAWELYLRGARQFPAHGPSADDSFYYCPSQQKSGRIFVGLLGVARKHTPSVTKALSIFYQQVQKARDVITTDPVKAASVYGIGQLSASDQKDLLFLYELALTYVLTRKGSDQVAEAIESRVRRELQESSPQHGELLIEMFNGGVDVSHMISTMDELKSETSAADPSTRTRGIVTTNIIGHGVDVDRFNVILFAGFTRLVAEYIQASARVGRRFPGISIFVPTPQSERDRSIFDRFAKFHQYLDRLVDPAAVTRWPEPAMRRTLPGMLCGYLMGVASFSLNRPLATVEAIHEVHGDPNAIALTQDEVVKWLVAAYGCEHAPSPVRYRERLTREAKNKFSSIVNTPKQRRGMPRALGAFLDAMNSLRDVDEPADIRVGNSDEAKALKRLIDVQ